MLKQAVAAATVLIFAAAPLVAQGRQSSGNEMTITGQVVDLNCYTTHGESDAKHKACAQACAKSGVALGILGADGIVYLPVSSKPGDPQNSKLAPFADEKVKVTGTHRFANGLHTIEITSIVAAT